MKHLYVLPLVLVGFVQMSFAKTVTTELKDRNGKVVGTRTEKMGRYGTVKKTIDTYHENSLGMRSRAVRNHRTGKLKNCQWKGGQKLCKNLTDFTSMGENPKEVANEVASEKRAVSEMRTISTDGLKPKEIKIDPKKLNLKLAPANQHLNFSDLTVAQRDQFYKTVGAKLNPAQRDAFKKLDCQGKPFSLSSVVPNREDRLKLTGGADYDILYTGNSKRPGCR